MSNFIPIVCALLYLALLFGIAYYAEYKQKQGKSLINSGYVYALSLAVYCTAWTYYGSVGRATTNGIEFLSIYLGPTLAAILFWPVLQKIIRICKTHRINSIADLISIRYGKNFSIAILVTVLSVLGVIPYIALQLKAISSSIHIVTGNLGPEIGLNNFFSDDTFYITLILSVFIILFGTRSIDASEKHEGLVAAVAFESIIKLIAFLAAGAFVVYGVFNGFEDIFNQALAKEDLKKLFVIEGNSSYGSWIGLTIVSMLAVLFLPRQFQVSVVENVSEKHLNKASWLFPLYLLLINIFVFPIALGGNIIFSGTTINADTYVLALPLKYGMNILSIVVFIGGFSAATSMIIVDTIALSTMMSNNIATPLFLTAKKFKPATEGGFIRSLLNIRRLSIVVILALAYIYDKTIAQNLSLVSIGLVSFVAVAQFAPAVLGGIYWKDASKNGAIAGMSVGFAIWFFTLVVPSLVSAQLIDADIMESGLFGIEWLKPFSLFGLQGFDSISHAVFWSLLANITIFIGVSFYSKRNAQEIYQSELLVDIFKHYTPSESTIWKGTAYLPDLNSLLVNFIGADKAEKLITGYATRNKISLNTQKADPRLVGFAERILSGVIGSASARIMVQSVTKEEELKIDEVLHILRESQQMMELNKELRKKSLELQKATEQLTKVNEQMKQMDVLKDEFLYTVTHELRTPLTSIRAMAEIVYDNPEIGNEEKEKFLGGIIKETERLSHLITQVLNLERYESGRQKLHVTSINLNKLIKENIDSMEALARERNVKIMKHLPDTMFLIQCDADLIQQVMNNLISNALKFVEPGSGWVKISIHQDHEELQVWVEDNGAGIADELKELVFDKFFQARNQTLKKPQGSGLGLAICRRIIEMHNGKIWVEKREEKGSRFIFTLPNN